jgi:hypothetical protein
MLTSYAGRDHRGIPEGQRRFDSGSLNLSQVTKIEGYMATSRQLRLAPIRDRGALERVP